LIGSIPDIRALPEMRLDTLAPRCYKSRGLASFFCLLVALGLLGRGGLIRPAATRKVRDRIVSDRIVHDR
jgi:hypothetical protein